MGEDISRGVFFSKRDTGATGKGGKEGEKECWGIMICGSLAGGLLPGFRRKPESRDKEGSGQRAVCGWGKVE